MQLLLLLIGISVLFTCHLLDITLSMQFTRNSFYVAKWKISEKENIHTSLHKETY